MLGASHASALRRGARYYLGEIQAAAFIVAFNHGWYPSLRITKAFIRRFDAIMAIGEGRSPEWRGSLRQQADDLWLFLTWDPTNGILRPRTERLDLPGRDGRRRG